MRDAGFIVFRALGSSGVGRVFGAGVMQTTDQYYEPVFQPCEAFECGVMFVTAGDVPTTSQGCSFVKIASGAGVTSGTSTLIGFVSQVFPAAWGGSTNNITSPIIKGQIDAKLNAGDSILFKAACTSSVSAIPFVKAYPAGSAKFESGEVSTVSTATTL